MDRSAIEWGELRLHDLGLTTILDPEQRVGLHDVMSILVVPWRTFRCRLLLRARSGRGRGVLYVVVRHRLLLLVSVHHGLGSMCADGRGDGALCGCRGGR